MNPSNLDPLFRRLNEVFMSGSGVSPENDAGVRGTYFIASGSFDLQWWYAERETEAVAKSAMHLPQLKYRVVSLTPAAGGWNSNYFEKLYDVTIGIDLSYYTDSKFLKERRDAITSKLSNDVLQIVRTITKPNNLLRTDDGTETGLCGGCFLEPTAVVSEFVFDPANSLLQGTLTIRGKAVISNELPSP